MSTNPQPLVRHGVRLPPPSGPAAAKKPTKAAVSSEGWAERQRLFRRLAGGVVVALLLLLAVAVATQRSLLPKAAGSVSGPATRAPAVAPIPVKTAISGESEPRKPPTRAGTAVLGAASHQVVVPAPHSAPLSRAQLTPQKIAATESGTKAEAGGVSKPLPPPVSVSAFDAPFVPPAD